MLNNVVSSVGSMSGFIAVDLEAPSNDLNPIAPELKEMAWGFGSFVVLAVVLRYLIWPQLRSSIDARNAAIAADRASAVEQTAAARRDVADYEAQRVAIRAEAQVRVDAARAVLEAERAERLAEVNARIAERRAAALDEIEQARAAARGEVEAAVAAVAARAGQLATGRTPDDAVVRRVVDATLSAGATR